MWVTNHSTVRPPRESQVTADRHTTHGLCTYLKHTEEECEGFLLPKESAPKDENYSRDKQTVAELRGAADAATPLAAPQHSPTVGLAATGEPKGRGTAFVPVRAPQTQSGRWHPRAHGG